MAQQSAADILRAYNRKRTDDPAGDVLRRYNESRGEAPREGTVSNLVDVAQGASAGGWADVVRTAGALDRMTPGKMLLDRLFPGMAQGRELAYSKAEDTLRGIQTSPENQPAEGTEDTFPVRATQAVYGSAPSVLLAAGTGGAGLGVKAATGLLAGYGGAVAGTNAYYTALEHKATPVQAWNSAISNGLVGGGIGLLQFGRVFAAAERMVGAGFRQKLMSYALTGGVGAAGASTQQFLSNAIANAMTPEDRKMAEGVLRAGEAGALTSVLSQFIVGTGQEGKAQGEEQAKSQKIKGETAEAEAKADAEIAKQRAEQEAETAKQVEAGRVKVEQILQARRQRREAEDVRAQAALQQPEAEPSAPPVRGKAVELSPEQTALARARGKMSPEEEPGPVPRPNDPETSKAIAERDAGEEARVGRVRAQQAKTAEELAAFRQQEAQQLAQEREVLNTDPDVLAYLATKAKQALAQRQDSPEDSGATREVADRYSESSGPRAQISKETWAEREMRRIVDHMGTMFRAQREAAEQLPLPKDADFETTETLKKGRLYGDIQQDDAEHLNPFKKVARGLNLDKFDDWMLSHSARQRDAWQLKYQPLDQNGRPLNPHPSGTTPEQVAEARRWYENLKPEERANAQRARRIIRKMLDGDPDRTVKEGLETQEYVDAVKATGEHDYVPRRTDMDNDRFGGGGRGLAYHEWQRAFGRSTRPDSPTAFAFMQHYRLLARIREAQSRRALLKLVESINNPEFAKVGAPERRVLNKQTGRWEFQSDPLWRNDPSTVVVPVNGERVPITFGKDFVDIARAINGETMTQPGDVVQALGKYTKLLAKWSTRHNPAFWPVNFSRDLIQLANQNASKHGISFAARVVRNLPAAWKEIRAAQRDPLNAPEAFQRYRDAGGEISALGLEDFDTRYLDLQSALEGGDAKKVWRSAVEYVDGISDAIEMVNRYSTFKELVRQGMDDAAAAKFSKEAGTNFERRGEIAPVMNSLYLFSNAGIQGTRSFVRFAKSPGGQKLLAGQIGLGMLLDNYNRIIGGEKYDDEIDEGVKAGHIILMAPTDIGPIKGGEDYLAIPVPPLFLAGMNFGRLASAAAFGKESIAGAAGKMAGQTLAQGSPFGGQITGEDQDLKSAVIAAAPSVPLKLGVQAVANTDSFGRQIMPQDRGFGPDKPDSEKYHASVHPLLREVTAALNSATDLDDSGEGGISISPETLEHVFEGSFGGAGREVSRLSKLAIKGLGEGEITEHDWPILQRFYGTPNPYAVDRKFSENRQAIQSAAQRLKDLGGSSNERGRKFRESHPLARYARRLAVYEERLQAIPDNPANEERRRALKARFNKLLLTGEGEDD